MDIRKEIERAAKRGQSITVTKKKSELEEYRCEIDKERNIFEENEKKCTELLKRLEDVDGDLGEYGVSSPSIDALSMSVIFIIVFNFLVKSNYSINSHAIILNLIFLKLDAQFLFSLENRFADFYSETGLIRYFQIVISSVIIYLKFFLINVYANFHVYTVE